MPVAGAGAAVVGATMDSPRLGVDLAPAFGLGCAGVLDTGRVDLLVDGGAR